MHSLKYPTRVVGAALVFGLVASACGTDAAPSIDAAAPVDQAADVQQNEEPEAPDVAEDDSSAAAPSESEDAQAEEQDEAPVGDHLFPDIETVNIVDGSTLNLADELAGGDTPILLWFWAPH